MSARVKILDHGYVALSALRAKHKANELEDLKKARWYLDRLISNLEAER